ncbi:MAG: DUF4830 domain-containing protein [Oscillospiraceae bacterium]|nr:DUF4830 domain-containing protein [Oscillospiraceae bacterium]
MLILTARLPRRRLILGAICIVCIAALLTGLRLNRPAESTVMTEAAVSPQGIRDNSDRLDYLEQFGWLVNQAPSLVEEVRIPDVLTEEYTDYAALQASQGFDLEKYCGRTVRRYSYEILNYPTGETGVTANLLIYRNTVVGADVCSAALDGFMHGLEMPA